MKAVSTSLEEEVHIREGNGKIGIEPIQPRRYDLTDLLKGITAKNQYHAVDFGKPQGKELW